MTHEELLRAIEWEGRTNLHRTLRAVVELHSSEGRKSHPTGPVIAHFCTFDNELYPCKTIQAIEKELA
jgi:hypothetical protein